MAVRLLMIACSLVFLLLPNKLHSQSDVTIFDFTEFGRNEPDLILQGDAILQRNAYRTYDIALTSMLYGNRVGRALYSHPIRLWDRAGRRQATFQTAFTGSMTIGVDKYVLNGISFFIAPVNATIPMASTTRGNMGLYDNSSGLAPVPLFAVELDYTVDSWDPDYRHVGININSRVSDAVGRWQWDNLNISGYPWIESFEARITYDARQRLISAFVNATAANLQTEPIVVSVEHTFDLKTILPEWVQIGFSAYTEPDRVIPFHFGGNHDIRSWSFTSFMLSDDVNNNPQYV